MNFEQKGKEVIVIGMGSRQARSLTNAELR